MNVGLVSPVNDKQLGIRDVPSEIQTSLKRQCGEFNVQLLSLSNEHSTELNKITSDQNLSDVGKSTKRTDLFDSYAARVARIGEEAKLWTIHAENFRAQIRRDEAALMPPAGDPVAESRAREIRALMRSVDAPERVKIFSAAMSGDDYELMAAVERSPRAFPLIESDILTRLVEDRRQKSHPAKIADAQSLDEAATWLTNVCIVARQRMSR